MTGMMWSTHRLAESERLSALRDDLFRPLFNMDIATLERGPFSGFLQSVNFGPISITQTSVTSSVISRDEAQAARAQDEAVYFDFMLHGELTVRQDGQEVRIDHAQCAVSSARRPYVNILDGADGRAHMLTVTVPKTVLQRDFARPGWGIETFDLLYGGARLLGSTVRQAMEEADYLAGSQREVVGRLVVDLIRSLTRAEPVDLPRRSPAYLRIQATVAERFREQALSADEVARASGLSSRSMRRLLLDAGTSLTEMLHDMRADEMFKQLQAPGMVRQTVTEIALASGFGDVNTAGRVFRARYGKPPSACRDTKALMR